jgi:hypothetical protein
MDKLFLVAIGAFFGYKYAQMNTEQKKMLVTDVQNDITDLITQVETGLEPIIAPVK